MRATAVWRIVVCLLAATSVAACSGPLDNAPEPLRGALEPFLKAGYACVGPSSDHSAFTQWQCDRQDDAGVHVYVVLDGDDSGIKQVTATVDQSAAGSIQRDVVSTFFSDVAAIDVAGSATAVQDWVGAHMSAGGQEQIGRVLITLDSLRRVDHMVIFATD
jgi:hypothetical protein